MAANAVKQPSNKTMKNRKATFSIDGIEGQSFTGWTTGETWNGWATPYFEFEQAEKITAALGKDCGRFDPAADAFITRESCDMGVGESETWTALSIETPDGTKKVYAIGAYGWCWQEDKETRTSQDFPDDYTIPDEIAAALDRGDIVDVSWHNDACPSFALKGSNGADYALCCDHPDPQQREFGPECERFRVCSGSGDDSAQEFYEGEDVNAALEALMHLRHETPVGAYSSTPHKTIEQLETLAYQFTRKGASPFYIHQDIVNGYSLGFGSLNATAIHKACGRGCEDHGKEKAI